MSIADIIPVKPYIEAEIEILSIQKAAIVIASNGIRHKISISKKSVDEFTLDYLSAKFSTSIVSDEKSKYIIISSEHCDINVTLKEE